MNLWGMNTKLVHVIVAIVATLGVIGMATMNIPTISAVINTLAQIRMIDRIDLKIGSRMTGIRTTIKGMKNHGQTLSRIENHVQNKSLCSLPLTTHFFLAIVFR